MASIEQLHTPVMADECMRALRPALTKPGAVYVDATTGLAGHLQLVLTTFPQVQAIAIDRDSDALALARQRLGDQAQRCRFYCTTYDRLGEVIAAAGYFGADAILMDLGVSSLQLDKDDRGFSYARDTALDMRMDQSSGETAAELLQRASAGELTRILREFGEEKFASRIANAIVAQRDTTPITTSAQLVTLIRQCLPQAAMRHGGNPAKRTFQALRIAVNHELDILQRALPAAVAALNPGGRLVVESYHSLEDRAVKRVFRDATTSKYPADLPLPESAREVENRLVYRGALQASAAERAANPRATSVRLRCLEKLAGSSERKETR